MDEEKTAKPNTEIPRSRVIILICILAVLGLVSIVVPIVLIFSCQDEYQGYSGKYPELFTVAIDSIPDAKGYLNGEITHEPVLCLIEEDEYGRKMFCYMDAEYNDGKYDIPIYLLVCQARVDDEAYYYADCNLVRSNVSDYPSRVKPGGTGHTSWIKNPLSDFSQDQISKLKSDNDWDKELNLDGCKKAKVIRKKI